ncbi:MAG: glycosyltransferase family 2 protein [Fibrobacter sp.]|nr:glycosyltransferase family 2 protein [Fibrobacter sp.]
MVAPDFDTFIFVPAYNVEKTLCSVLDKIPESVWKRSKILVINDGSIDGTAEILKKYQEDVLVGSGGENSRATRLECFEFQENRGYGAVVKKGISKALESGAKFVVCLHGDGQYPANLLDEFLKHLENFKIEESCNGRVEKLSLALLQGSRHGVAGGAKAGNMPFYKRWGGLFLTTLENCVFKYKLTDRHSGFILYNADFLRRIDLEKLSPSFDIDLELIAIADAMAASDDEGEKMALGELPIPTVYQGEKSNLNVVDYGFRCLRQIYRRYRRNFH